MKSEREIIRPIRASSRRRTGYGDGRQTHALPVGSGAQHDCAGCGGGHRCDRLVHREAVDVASYPWSAIGKLFNEAGGACTGAIIARDKILTAAHCVYNERTRRFLPASALHFMVGYRSGQAAVHARVASV